MGFDSLAEPGSPIPDRIPDELVARYGDEARRAVRRKTVRRRRLRSPALGREMKDMTGRVRDGEVWMVALTVFGCSIIGLGLIGALVYAVFLWPWVGAGVSLSAITLLCLSYWTAVRLTRRARANREIEASR
jgi:Flp pilus assembly protein TadB